MIALSGPDGCGFYYGQHDGRRIDLMPPAGGQLGMDSDPKKWIAYIDGEEIGRFENRDAALDAVLAH